MTSKGGSIYTGSLQQPAVAERKEDRSPGDSGFNHLASYRVKAAEMLPTPVKNLYFAVQGVPRIDV
jgi:hypothetical protein